MTTPSRARPSDRAIAAAYEEYCAANAQNILVVGDVQFAVMRRANELDTEPRAVDGDARKAWDANLLYMSAAGIDPFSACGAELMHAACMLDAECLAAQRNEGALLSNLEELDSKSIGGQRSEGDGE